MPRYKITAPDGNSYQIDGPEGATQEQVQAEVLRQFPQAGVVPRGEGDKVMGAPSTPEGIMGGIFGAGQPKELNTVQSIGNAVLPHLATAPTIMAGGEAVPAAAWAGRALTSGGLGAAKAASRGESPGWAFAIDTLLGLGAEGVAKVAPYFMKVPRWTRSVGEMADTVKGEAAKSAAFRPQMRAAADAVKQQVQNLPREPFLSVPSLDKANPMTFDEVMAGLNKLKGTPQFGVARDQAIRALDAFAPDAGNLFGRMTTNPAAYVPYRPTGAERLARDVVGTLNTPTLRSMAQTAPAGALDQIGIDREKVPDMAGSGLSAIAHQIPILGRYIGQ